MPAHQDTDHVEMVIDPPVVYLAHPVAPLPDDVMTYVADGWRAKDAEVDLVERNIARALSWMAWLVKHTGWAICAPWIPYVDALGEDGAEMRERGLRDNVAIVRRCDAIVLVGGRMSCGMARELEAAQASGLAILDLTDLGEHPPDEPPAAFANRLRLPPW